MWYNYNVRERESDIMKKENKEQTTFEKMKKRNEIKLKISQLILENSKNDQEYFLNLLYALDEINTKLNNFNDITIDK